MEKNYQPVVIKFLNESTNGTATRDQIKEELQKENKGIEIPQGTVKTVTDALVRKNVIKSSDGSFQLIGFETFNDAEKKSITSYCESKIGTKVNYIIEEFEGTVDKTQLQVLKKFYKKMGKNMRAKNIFGDREKGEKLPRDLYVEEEHYMHNLIRGVYKPEGSEFPQALMLNPESRWNLEIDREYPTLRLNYDFHEEIGHEKDIELMKKCYKIKLPVGIFFRLKKNLYKCLGLGQIVFVDGTKFVIESFGISDYESGELKEEALMEYDSLTKETSVANIENVDFEKITRDDLKGRFSSDDLNYTVQLERRSLRLSNIVEKCDSGELVIPDFQRFFVWSKEMVTSFFDSIFNGYYIGPFLFWEPGNKKSIGTIPIRGVENKKPIGNQIVIDGQQRISSIYYALRAPDFALKKKDSRSFFYIDFGSFLKNYPEHENTIQVFSKEIDPEDQYKKLFFPLNQLENYEKWLDELETFLVENFTLLDYRKDLKPLLDTIKTKLRFILREFECPYIALQNIELDDVVNIFTRINTTGQKLNAFDLLIADLSPHGIKLRKMWENACKEFPRVERYLEKSKNSTQGLPILHSMSMSYTDSGSCKRTDILTIFERMKSSKLDFEEKWAKSLLYTDLAIDLLEEKSDDGFGVIDPNFLPSESIIPVMASLLLKIHNNFKKSEKDCNEKLRFWYWTSVLTNAYSGSSDSKKTSDFKQISEWFSNETTPQGIIDFQNNFFQSSTLNLFNVVKKGSSTFNAVLCLSALRGAKDWAHDRGVMNQKTSLKQYKLDVDHIFPKVSYGDEVYNESILNKTWQSKETNEHTKNAKKPNVFLDEILKNYFKNNVKDLLENLQTHFVNRKGYEALMENNSQKFIQEREYEILKEIGRKIGSKNSSFISPLKSKHVQSHQDFTIEDLIKMPESDMLEFKSTMLFDLRKKSANKTLKNIIGKTITGFLNNKGGTLIIGYDQMNHEIVGIEKDYQLYDRNLDEDIAWDKWQLTFKNMIENLLKPSHASSLIQQVEPKKIEGKTLVSIKVEPSKEGVYFDNQFFVRRIGATEKLEGRDLADYIKNHFTGS